MRRESGSIRVVVIEGKVRVEIAQGPTASLTAGAVSLSTDAGTLVRAGSLSDAEDDLAWLHGVLVFHETTLAEATAEFNRYNNRKIIITDSAIGALRIAGAFRVEQPRRLRSSPRTGLPNPIREQGDQILLMGSGAHSAAE